MLPILCRSGSFVTRGIFRRQLCSPVASSSDASVSDIVKTMLPSESFLEKNVRKPSQRMRLAQRVAELHLFIEHFNEHGIPTFNDSLWATYINLFTVDERCNFLYDLLKANTSTNSDVDKVNKIKISEINQQKYDQDEMIYAPGFHSLIELLGKDFRSKINIMYGSRLLSQERMDECLPKLVVDCRFMREYTISTQTKFLREIQSLHDGNWTSRLPFNISVANLRPDSQLAENMKRSLLFRFGPPNDAETNYDPHPLSPIITPRSVKETVGCEPERIMYVSWKAKKFLPPIPPSVDAVVLCASTDYQPSTSSISAAAHDRLEAFRIPVEQYVRFDGARRVLSLRKSAAILRSYFSGEDIADTIKQAYDFKPTDSTRSRIAIERNKMEAYRQKLEALDRERSRLDVSDANMGRKPKGFQQPSSMRTHRYAREERSEKRSQVVN